MGGVGCVLQPTASRGERDRRETVMDIKNGDWVRVQGGPTCYYAIVEGVVTYVCKDNQYWMIEAFTTSDDKPRRCWYWKQRHDGGQVLEHRPQ